MSVVTTGRNEKAHAVEGSRPARTPAAPSSARRRRRVGRRLSVLIAQILTIVAIVVIWRLIATGANERTLGTPDGTAEEVWRWLTTSERWDATLYTLGEAAAGTILGVIVGTAVAVIVMSSSVLYALTRPLLAAINATPKLVLVPLFILLWGIGSNSRIYYLSFALFYFPFAAIVTAYRDIDPEIKASLRILGASHVDVARQLYVPTTLAGLLTSLRLMIPWALAATVLAETLVVQPGNMGSVVANGQALLNGNEVLGTVVFIALIALVSDRIVVLVERRYLRWRKR